MSYQEQWCDRCIHDDPVNEIYCPIWNLHLIHNYEAANDYSHWLHSFIPLNKERLCNDQCRMFVERTAGEAAG